MSYRAMIAQVPGYIHLRVLSDVAQAFDGALQELGWYDPAGRPLFFGANLRDAKIPTDAIIVQLEARTSNWFSYGYLDRLRNHAVLDYDAANVEWLKAQGINARWCPIRYHKSLSRLPRGLPKEMDLLFYGGASDRRLKILRAIETVQGGALRCKFIGHHDVWGTHDHWIPRTKIIFNCHFYEGAPLEMVRISYALANGAFVLSEGPRAEWLQEGMCFFDEGDAEGAAAQAYLWALDDVGREKVAQRGYDLFTGTSQAAVLREVLQP